MSTEGVTALSEAKQRSDPGGPPGRPWGLDLLPFELPPFQRVSWAGENARAIWEPRLRRIFEAWREVEVVAVLEGIRACSVASVPASAWPDFEARCRACELKCERVAVQSTVSHQEPGSTEDEALSVYRVALGAADDVSDLLVANERSDETSQAELLGQPSCCFDFQRRVWVDHGLQDPTWPMAASVIRPPEGTRLLEFDAPAVTNVLWRWMGIRGSSHMPCSFWCEQTVTSAERLLALARDHGLAAEVDWIEAILDWPVEWSALHGIAEIKTPILKVAVNTDATASKFVARRKSSSYPAEGAHGLSFPYRLPGHPQFTQSKRYRAGLANPLPILD